jgi:hypothetical protein
MDVSMMNDGVSDAPAKQAALSSHCLTKNLTLHSSTNTASGNIVAFSTLSPLHQFPFVKYGKELSKKPV